jgi:hypothetical protein
MKKEHRHNFQLKEEIKGFFSNKFIYECVDRVESKYENKLKYSTYKTSIGRGIKVERDSGLTTGVIPTLQSPDIYKIIEKGCG